MQPFLDKYSADSLRKVTGKAIIQYSENPGFISFKSLSISAANSSVKKLIAAGYDAQRVENFVKINRLQN